MLKNLLRNGHLPPPQAVKRTSELAKQQLDKEDGIAESGGAEVTFSQNHTSGPLLEGFSIVRPRIGQRKKTQIHLVGLLALIFRLQGRKWLYFFQELTKTYSHL